jgi:hypothetical protein
MKNFTSFLTTLSFVFLLNATAFAQFCAGPSSLKTLSAYGSFAQIIWKTGGSAESLRYRVFGTTDWTTLPNVTSPYDLTNLTPETLYEYDITTDCPTYTRPSLPFFRFKTLPACRIAVDINETSVHVNSVTLNWTFGGGISGERVAYRAVGETDFVVTPTNVKSPYTIRGLKLNTTYEYQVLGNCPSSPRTFDIIRSEMHTFTTPETASCGDARLSLTTESSSSILARWFSGGTVSGYELCYKSEKAAQATCVTLPSNTTSYSISGPPSTGFEVSLKTTCSDGTVYEEVQSAATAALPPCPSPINLRVTDVQPNYVFPGVIAFNVTFGWDFSASSTTDFKVDRRSTRYIPGREPFEITPSLDNPPTFRTLVYFTRPGFRDVIRIITRCPDGSSNEAVIDYTQPVTGGESRLLFESFDKQKAIALFNKAYSIQNNAHTEGDIENLILNPTTPQKNRGMSILPNPAKENIVIDLPEAGFQQINITSIDGRIIKQINLEENTISQKIDCSDLANGLYFMSAKGNGRVLTEKFVKN